eukprot:GSA25T00021472001.1
MGHQIREKGTILNAGARTRLLNEVAQNSLLGSCAAVGDAQEQDSRAIPRPLTTAELLLGLGGGGSGSSSSASPSENEERNNDGKH